MPKKYVSRPIEIEAIQFTGTNANFDKIHEFFDCEASFTSSHNSNREVTDFNLSTLEGLMRVAKGSYIVKGIEGEFYPVKESIFEAKYQEVTCD